MVRQRASENRTFQMRSIKAYVLPDLVSASKLTFLISNLSLQVDRLTQAITPPNALSHFRSTNSIEHCDHIPSFSKIFLSVPRILRIETLSKRRIASLDHEELQLLVVHMITSRHPYMVTGRDFLHDQQVVTQEVAKQSRTMTAWAK